MTKTLASTLRTTIMFELFLNVVKSIIFPTYCHGQGDIPKFQKITVNCMTKTLTSTPTSKQQIRLIRLSRLIRLDQIRLDPMVSSAQCSSKFTQEVICCWTRRLSIDKCSVDYMVMVMVSVSCMRSTNVGQQIFLQQFLLLSW